MMLEIERPIPSELVWGCWAAIRERIASCAMYGASRKKLIATSRSVRCLASGESRREPVKRQMTITEASASIAESMPFAVALLASGASSSSVGTFAGQVVMAGFINFQIPLALRRAITMTPAIVILAVGMNPTSVLVLSQVVLSFGIPFALVPLVMLTGRREIMGNHANGRILATSAWAIAIAISLMNVFLIYQQFFMG